MSEPLPACLESLLTKNILVNAKRDGLQKTKNLLERDRVVLNKIRKHRDAIREVFEAVCKADTSIKQGPIAKLTLNAFTNDLYERKVICDTKVSPTPQVAGDVVPEFHVALTMADAKQAFLAMGTGDVDAESITFDEVCNARAAAHCRPLPPVPMPRTAGSRCRIC